MKTIIAGSRSVHDYEEIRKAVELSQFEITEVVSGTCHGPDKFGEMWAALNHRPVKQYPANWTGEGKGAGFNRNRLMADYADALIACWDGSSRGTAHMIACMRERKKKVFIHYAPR